MPFDSREDDDDAKLLGECVDGRPQMRSAFSHSGHRIIRYSAAFGGVNRSATMKRERSPLTYWMIGCAAAVFDRSIPDDWPILDGSPGSAMRRFEMMVMGDERIMT